MHPLTLLFVLPFLSVQGTPSKEELRSIVEKLQSGSKEEQKKAAGRLVAFGPAALPAAELLLASKDPELRERAAYVVGRLRWGPAMSLRLERLADDAFTHLGHPDPARRVAGVRRITEVVRRAETREGAGYLFAGFLHDSSYPVAREAYLQLKHRGSDRVLIDGFLSMLALANAKSAAADSGEELAEVVDRVLGSMTPADLPRLQTLLRVENPTGRLCGSTLALGLGDPEGGAEALRALDEGDWRTAIALRGAVRFPHPKAQRALNELTSRKDVPIELKALASLSLARLGERIDPKPIYAWANSKDPSLAIPALRALGELRDEDAVKQILGRIQRRSSDELMVATLEMVASLDTAGGYEAFFEALRRGARVYRPFRSLPPPARKKLQRGLLPLRFKAGRDRMLSIQMRSFFERGTLNDLAAEILADQERPPHQVRFALGVLARPLTVEQEAFARKRLVEAAGENPRLMGQAAKSLHLMAPELVKIARRHLQDGPEENALHALYRWGDAGDIPLLRRLLPLSKKLNRGLVLSALAKHGDKEVLDEMIARLKMPGRTRYYSDLEHLWSEEVADRLASLLEKEDERASWRAILSLFHTQRDRRIVPAYRRFFDDSEPSLRGDAAGLAGIFKDKEAIPILRILSVSIEKSESIRALQSLALLGDASIEKRLVRQLVSDDYHERSWAISTLGLLGTPSAIAILRRVSLTGETYNRNVAIEALSNLGSREVLESARRAVDARERGYTLLTDALEALARVGEPSDAALVLPLACEGNIDALRAQDRIVHRKRYEAVEGEHEFTCEFPLEQAAKRVSDRFGAPIQLSKRLVKASGSRSSVHLKGRLDFPAAVARLTWRLRDCSPLFDGAALRLVAFEEAVAYWNAWQERAQKK